MPLTHLSCYELRLQRLENILLPPPLAIIKLEIFSKAHPPSTSKLMELLLSMAVCSSPVKVSFWDTADTISMDNSMFANSAEKVQLPKQSRPLLKH